MGKKIDRPKQEVSYKMHTRAVNAGGIIAAPSAFDPAAVPPGIWMNYTPSTTTASTSYNVAQVLSQNQ